MPPWPPRSTASIGPRRPESDVAGRPGGPVVTSTADLEEGAGPPGGPAPGRVVPASARDDRPGRALGMAGGFGEPGSPGMAGQRRGRAGWPLRSERPVHLRLPAPSLRPRRARSWSRPSQGRCALPFSRVGPPWGVAERPVPVPECPDLPQRSGFCRGVRGESLVFWAFFAVDSASRFLCGRFGQPSARVSPRILARPIGRACLRLMVDGEMVEVSPDVADVLVRVARAMQRGLAVTVAPQSTRLTTQEAADMLGISRST